MDYKSRNEGQTYYLKVWIEPPEEPRQERFTLSGGRGVRMREHRGEACH